VWPVDPRCTGYRVIDFNLSSRGPWFFLRENHQWTASSSEGTRSFYRRSTSKLGETVLLIRSSCPRWSVAIKGATSGRGNNSLKQRYDMLRPQHSSVPGARWLHGFTSKGTEWWNRDNLEAVDTIFAHPILADVELIDKRKISGCEFLKIHLAESLFLRTPKERDRSLIVEIIVNY